MLGLILMIKGFLKNIKHDFNQVGIITNLFSKQFLEREFNIFQIPKKNFAEYIDINNISVVFIDNEIFETDHLWYKQERTGLLAHLKLKNIKVIFIKNTSKKIYNSFLEYHVIEMDSAEFESKSRHTMLPIIINEKKYNPAHSVKKLDALYLKPKNSVRSENLSKYHAALKPVKEEIVYEELSRKIILNLIEKIKESKWLYIYAPSSMDPIILKYIELMAVMQNTLVIYSDTELSSKFAVINEEAVNINKMAIMKSDTHYLERLLLPIQRKAFIEHSFAYYGSLSNLLGLEENHHHEVDVSVITSTNRKDNLSRYIKQLNKQRYMRLQVILVTHGFELSEKEKEKMDKNSPNLSIEIINVSSEMPLGFCLNTAISKVTNSYVAKMDDDDFYFENYLIDSWIASKYSDADLVGKLSSHTYFEGSNIIISKHPNTKRKYHDFVMGATFFATEKLMKKYMFSDLPTGEDSDFLRRIAEDKAVVYADHPYNFCIYRSSNIDSHTWKISDIDFMRNSQIVSYDEPIKYLSF